MSTVSSHAAASETVLPAKPAFLRRVRIRGYKSIAFCDVTLEPLTILVGRNASGKSNFLDALAFVRDSREVGVAEASSAEAAGLRFTAGPHQGTASGSTSSCPVKAGSRLLQPVVHPRNGPPFHNEPDDASGPPEQPASPDTDTSA
jgi:hypothetical protein